MNGFLGIYTDELGYANATQAENKRWDAISTHAPDKKVST